MLNTHQSVALHQAAYLSLASEAFGDAGAAALRVLLDGIARIYEQIPPDALAAGITVMMPIAAVAIGPGEQRFDDVSALGLILGRRSERAQVRITPDEAFVLEATQPEHSPVAASNAALVYEHDGTMEQLHAMGTTRPIPRLDSTFASAFAKPTFKEMAEVLDFYARKAADCSCDTLAGAWAGGKDGARLVLTPKPEEKMRDSLYDTLQKALRHASVSREYNTDATRPVDIKVTWHTAPVEALIEVKWIGRSLTDGKTPYLNYTPSRANDGAKQLADYLERERANGSSATTKGYLAVFDARRRKVKGPDDPLSKADATWFEDKDVEYAPDHTKTVTGFETPIRFFMRPRETHFADAA